MLKKTAILGLILAAMIPVGCSQNQQQANLDDQVEARLDSRNLKDVDADVKSDGSVELSGTVDNANQKQLAEETARSVNGVKRVDNLIKVRLDEDRTGINNNDVDKDDRDDTAVVDRTARNDNDPAVVKDKDKDHTGDVNKDVNNVPNDGWLSFKTKLALYADSRVPGNDINVEANKGVVTLVGKVPTAEAKSAAVDVAKKIKGVQNVKDQLQVVPASQRKVVNDKDENITDNVEAAFDKVASIKDLDLDVITNNGVVTVTGTADNMAQVEKAVHTAYNVNGVKAVNADAVVVKNIESDAKTNKHVGSY